MNIAENLTRIIQGKKDIVDTIAETGCPIPLDIKIEDIPEYIDKLTYKNV